jgi:hypothetical protein
VFTLLVQLTRQSFYSAYTCALGRDCGVVDGYYVEQELRGVGLRRASACKCMHECMYVCTYLCQNSTDIHLAEARLDWSPVGTCACVSECMYIHTYIHIYIYIYIYIHMHIKNGHLKRKYAYNYVFMHIRQHLRMPHVDITCVPEDITCVPEDITCVPEDITCVPEDITCVPEAFCSAHAA